MASSLILDREVFNDLLNWGSDVVEAHFPYSLSIKSCRPIRRSSLMIFLRSSGLYQKKNWRCASFSRCVLALHTGSSV